MFCERDCFEVFAGYGIMIYGAGIQRKKRHSDESFDGERILLPKAKRRRISAPLCGVAGGNLLVKYIIDPGASLTGESV